MCLPRLRRLCSSSPNKLLSLHDRGLLQSVFPEGSIPELSRQLSKVCTMYCGFDPTADSLHVGNLLALIALIHGQRLGHNSIAVIGGATALIGDPSGKTEERAPMSAAEVENNVMQITENIERVLDNYMVLNNMDWYMEKNIIEFLSTVGRHFRMGNMLSRHSVQSRINSPQGMSFTEFTYQIFQGYDWLHLHRTHRCTIQIGGNDQLGNITAGYELVTKFTKDPIFGLTVPLITTTRGDKLGKTSGNAVWLDAKKTSSFELYQYFINVSDADVEKYLQLFTFLPLPEISSIMSKHLANPEKRTAQKTLAEQVTVLVHGANGLDAAQRCTRAFFEESIEAINSLQPMELEQLFRQAPVKELFLDPGMTILEVCMKAGCFGRTVDAERIIRAGGVRLNHQRLNEPNFVLRPGEHVLSNNISLIRVGKKNYYIVKWCR
ncbi:hypothetical protein BaRGS_00032926 [Batillaria attramentaria]|uniref:Tyrosine--tRNA ligase n=1 Tax=Batillaria attramentaria TaxID=370345 RepID=A0ABD0JMG9_9CAEN